MNNFKHKRQKITPDVYITLINIIKCILLNKEFYNEDYTILNTEMLWKDFLLFLQENIK